MDVFALLQSGCSFVGSFSIDLFQWSWMLLNTLKTKQNDFTVEFFCFVFREDYSGRLGGSVS